MKILNLISLGYTGGGAESVVLLLKEPLEAHGHTYKFLASDIGRERPNFFADYTFAAQPTSGLGKYTGRIFHWQSYKALRTLLHDYQPDIVHLHTMGQLSPSVLFLLRNVPTVLTVHGPEEFTRWLLPWYLPSSDYRGDTYRLEELTTVGKFRYLYHRYINGPVYRLGLHNVDAIITVSSYFQHHLAAENLPSQLIPIGTPLLPNQPYSTGHQLLCVGRLEKYKGIEYAIRALPLILKSYPDTRLKIIGEGPDAERLGHLVDTLDLTVAVEFTGAVPASMLPEHYKAASIFLLPSTVPESFGKVGIEAMSTGTPVIASEVGGIPDWLADNQNGRLVQPGSHTEIARTVIDLFDHPDLMLKMSLEARITSEQYTTEIYSDKIEKLYRDLLKKN